MKIYLIIGIIYAIFTMSVSSYSKELYNDLKMYKMDKKNFINLLHLIYLFLIIVCFYPLLTVICILEETDEESE